MALDLDRDEATVGRAAELVWAAAQSIPRGHHRGHLVHDVHLVDPVDVVHGYDGILARSWRVRGPVLDRVPDRVAGDRPDRQLYRQKVQRTNPPTRTRQRGATAPQGNPRVASGARWAAWSSAWTRSPSS